jgi:Tetratricopeptide repeat
VEYAFQKTMAIHYTTRVLLSATLLIPACLAQSSGTQNPPSPPPCPASNPNNTQPAKPCTPAKPQPSSDDPFPFPGEPAKSLNAAPAAPDAPAPAPSNNAKPAPPASDNDDHPFPTAPAAKLPGSDDSNSSSSGSSSSSSSSSSDNHGEDDGTPDLPPGAEGTSVHRHPLPKVTHVQSDDERVDEDITVAKFYMNDENFAGALLRAKEAVKIQPDYSLAHFTLAQVLQKMKKKDEAIAEYQAYLKLDPDGEKAKAAKAALEELH